jgi:hypothetical protein
MSRWLAVACSISLFPMVACGGSGNDDVGNVSHVSEFPQVIFYGADPGDHLDAAVTGDFNGDGELDVAAAASLADGPDNSRVDAGELYTFPGPLNPGQALDAAQPGDYMSVIYGALPGGAFGRSLSSGDFNGDGIDDIAAGAPLGADPATGLEAPGTVFVIYGSNEFPGQIDLAAGDADVTITGADPGDGVGLSLVTADLDGAAGHDLVIGAHRADGPENSRPDAGEAYMLGGSEMTAQMTVPADVSATITGAGAGDHLSESMAAGDFDGNGAADLAIVATFADVNGEQDSGKAYLLVSPLDGSIDLSSQPAMITISGADAGDQIGHSLAVADWSGDGTDDLWLGSVSADGPSNAEDLAGEALLFVLDKRAGEDLDLADSEALVYGPGPKSRLGRNAAAGEFDNSPGEDVMFSAPDVAERRGELYLFTGGAQPPKRANEAPLTIRGKDPDDILGHESFGVPSIAGIDFDEDGRSELLVTAPNGDGPNEDRLDCGEVLILYLAGVKE